MSHGVFPFVITIHNYSYNTQSIMPLYIPQNNVLQIVCLFTDKWSLEHFDTFMSYELYLLRNESIDVDILNE